MHNLELITKYSCLSDEHRWSVSRFNFDNIDISENDKECIKNISAVGAGELTGIGAGILLFDLIRKEPKEYIKHWFTVYQYLEIIICEEFRHGMVISVLDDPDFIQQTSLEAFGKELVEDVQNPAGWDAYGLTMSLCLSECINGHLYQCISEKVESPELNWIFRQIMKDEARHLSAWKNIIKQMCEMNDYHREKFLMIAKESNYHNASIGSRYMEGVRGTFKLFKSDSVDTITKSKFDTLKYIFEEDMPFTQKQIKNNHMRFLATSLSG